MIAFIPVIVPATPASLSDPNPGAVIFIIGILLMLLSGVVYLLNKRFKNDGLEALSAISFYIGALMDVILITIHLAITIARLLGF